MGFVPGTVTVAVPATSANLGPGFDCLGLALDLVDTLTAEVTGSGLQVEVSGVGAADLQRDERHLVVRALDQGLAALGERREGLRLSCTNVIPQGSGLGSSAAAIIGGLMLARGLVENGAQRLDDAGLLRIANRMEGHPDNVAPALLGGFVISGQGADDAWAVRSASLPGLSVVVFVAPYGVSTSSARGLLPEQVPHSVASANTGRAALLVAALAGRPDLLFRATEDFLHQEFRGQAMPESLSLIGELRAQHVPAVLSGAGPTVLAFCLDDAAALQAHCPAGWTSLCLGVAESGARVVVP